MEFHVLDFFMYIALSIFIWIVILPNEAKEELGCLIGGAIILIFTIVYIILFAFWPNWNWSNFFHGILQFTQSIDFKL